MKDLQIHKNTNIVNNVENDLYFFFFSYCSIKDSPIQLDHDSVSDGAFSEFGGEGAVVGREGPRSVMAGGSVKGWLPDVAVVLWRRMLGSLGKDGST